MTHVYYVNGVALGAYTAEGVPRLNVLVQEASYMQALNLKQRLVEQHQSRLDKEPLVTIVEQVFTNSVSAIQRP